MKRVLVLGAGLVARPLVRYLLDKGHEVVCASRTVSKAEKLVDGHPNGRARELNLKDNAELSAAISECDLAVSLVPPDLHTLVARMCIDQTKPMVTTSYVSTEMEALDGPAKRAGVPVLNEIGVDPGIDHMSAMRIIDQVREKGGTIVGFRSYCGGLPAPEDNDNPFGYKFSWAPRGVLMASRNGAQYLSDGRKVVVSPERLFRDMHIVQLGEIGDFEAYPNRDSISYLEIYGLQGIQTLYRGTLRNMGWCDCMYHYRKTGLLELDEVGVRGRTYAQFMRELLGAGPEEDLRIAAGRRMGLSPDCLPPWNLHWLGAFSDRRFEVEKISALDALGALMFEKLAFKPGERDLIVLFHDFTAEYGRRRERITSELVEIGIEGGDSAMSRTVSLPAAIGAHLVLEGKIETPGVLRPVAPEIYNPVLDELARLGIGCREKTEVFQE